MNLRPIREAWEAEQREALLIAEKANMASEQQAMEDQVQHQHHDGEA